MTITSSTVVTGSNGKEGDGEDGNGNPVVEDPVRAHGCAPPRVETTEAPTEPIPVLKPHAGVWARFCDAVRRLGGSDPLTSTPGSVASMIAYTRAGGWIPGDRSPVLEAPGYVYGAVATVITAVSHLVIWTVQRPTRMATASLMVFLAGLAASGDPLWWWVW